MKSIVAGMMIALCCATAAGAGESGGVTRPPSIASGNIYQGYHPLGIYTSVNIDLITPTLAEIDYASMNQAGGADFVPPAVIDSPATAQGVPEPTSAMLGLGAAAFIAVCRGRRRG